MIQTILGTKLGMTQIYDENHVLVPVTVVEASRELPKDLRASTFHPPTLDMLERFGVTDKLIERGLVCPQWQFRDRNEGVVATFTPADIAGELRVGIIHKDWPVMIPVGGTTSCAGDVLAVVVAETNEQARAKIARATSKISARRNHDFATRNPTPGHARLQAALSPGRFRPDRAT